MSENKVGSRIVLSMRGRSIFKVSRRESRVDSTYIDASEPARNVPRLQRTKNLFTGVVKHLRTREKGVLSPKFGGNDTIMEGSDDNASEATSRWTCGACGCNTNTESDRNCTICGTSNGKQTRFFPSLSILGNFSIP